MLYNEQMKLRIKYNSKTKPANIVSPVLIFELFFHHYHQLFQLIDCLCVVSLTENEEIEVEAEEEES
uniref:Ovule protein n=1 Tax=Meloidogyne incognita TaxID=6306 RepID=A0A914MLC5_MELIC